MPDLTAAAMTAEAIMRGDRVYLPADDVTVTAFDTSYDRVEQTVTIYPAQRDLDAGADRSYTVAADAWVEVSR